MGRQGKGEASMCNQCGRAWGRTIRSTPLNPLATSPGHDHPCHSEELDVAWQGKGEASMCTRHGRAWGHTTKSIPP